MREPIRSPLSQRGRSLRLFLVDGTASGVIIAELGVSSLRAAVASRTALPDLIKRPEAEKTGIYLLVGPDPELAGRELVYVGEGDQVRSRLASHDSDPAKDFFTRAVLIVSKDTNLTKAHARYLESRVIAAIKDAKRAKLTNGTEPPFKGLPEPDVADMERVLDEIELLLPVLGFDILRAAGVEVSDNVASPSPKIATPFATRSDDIFTFTEAGTSARAYEGSGEFVILEGSLARLAENDSCGDSVKRQRAQMLADGILVPVEGGGCLRFTRDAGFDSSSRAASIVYGGNASGPQFWKHQTTKQSYRDWRADRIQAQTSSADNAGSATAI